MEDEQETEAVRFTVLESDETVGALFLRTGMPSPVHVLLTADWRSYNTLIGCECATMAGTKVPGLHLWIDDMGAVSGEKRVNALATVIAGQPIWGDALLLGVDETGNTRSVTRAEVFSVGEIIARSIERGRNDDR